MDEKPPLLESIKIRAFGLEYTVLPRDAFDAIWNDCPPHQRRIDASDPFHKFFSRGVFTLNEPSGIRYLGVGKSWHKQVDALLREAGVVIEEEKPYVPEKKDELATLEPE